MVPATAMVLQNMAEEHLKHAGDAANRNCGAKDATAALILDVKDVLSATLSVILISLSLEANGRQEFPPMAGKCPGGIVSTTVILMIPATKV